MCDFREDYKQALEIILDATMMRTEKRHLVAMNQALLKCREEKEELKDKLNEVVERHTTVESGAQK